jgi:hypothetical protein
MPTFYIRPTLIIFGVALLAACAEEPVPRSTSEFLEKPIMLEAAMVRCSKDRTATRYDAECINARKAVKLIEAKEESARRADLDAQSESKRQALRRTQEAASQARRRAAENERLRKEAEYLAQFGVALPPEEMSLDEEPDVGNSPLAVIPEGVSNQTLSSGPGDVLPATDGGNAPGSAAVPEEDPKSELESIRDELQRRNEDGSGD